MSPSARSHELIQKYLDGRTSTEETVELEGMLATDSAVADEFAAAARLHVTLRVHFQKQYQIDQIARLLHDADPVHDQSDELTARGKTEADGGTPDAVVRPARSTFVPRLGRLDEPRRSSGSDPAIPRVSFRRTTCIAVALLFLAACGSIWFVYDEGAVNRPRLLSGTLTIVGREIRAVPDGKLFEVAAHKPAIIDLPGGAQIELSPAAKALIRGDAGRMVVELFSGQGEFRVSSGQAALHVETPLGLISANSSQFSLDLLTTLPPSVSSATSLVVPQLTVAVAMGSVTIDRGGTSITLSAGTERVFF